MMYQLYYSPLDNTAPSAARTIGVEPAKSFIFDPANTDYANFKAQVLNDEAQLQDENGVIMSFEQAKKFVQELP